MIRTLGFALLAAATIASNADGEPAVPEFGDWRLHVAERHGDVPRAYLAYEPARGTNLHVYCTEIDGYSTPPYVRIAYFLPARLIAPGYDRSLPTLDVTYAIGRNGERVSDEWRLPMMIEAGPPFEATKVHAEAIIERMRHATGRFEFEALGQRVSPSLEHFDAAIGALEPYCGRHD